MKRSVRMIRDFGHNQLDKNIYKYLKNYIPEKIINFQPIYGYKRMHVLLRREGWKINRPLAAQG